MAYEINWEQAGVHRRFWGHVSDMEIAQSVGDASTDPRFNEMRYAIYDFSGCDDMTYTVEGTELLSALGVLSEMANPHIKIAIVADKPSTRGLGEAYTAAMLNRFPTGMFATLSEAREWLAMSNT